MIPTKNTPHGGSAGVKPEATIKVEPSQDFLEALKNPQIEPRCKYEMPCGYCEAMGRLCTQHERIHKWEDNGIEDIAGRDG